MSKSYWLKDQKGNFSNEQEENEKEDTFDPEKRYIGIRLQQGVPLLDRDWNELEDIRRYEEWKLRKWYVGNGTPDDGFKISAAGPRAKNNFKIEAGRCIVDGFEVVNDNDILYTDQDEVKHLSPGTNRVDTVYLDIWIEEVTHREDPALKNSQDVNIETCVRHKLEWRVRIDEGSRGHMGNEFHHHYDIAKIRRKAGRDTIFDTDIEDLRTTWLAVDLIQNRFKDVINTILKGNLPSNPEVQLVVVEEFDEADGYRLSFEDTKGNIWLFWYADNNTWCKTYSAGRWGAETQLTSAGTHANYQNAFEDAHGNIWLFWSGNRNIWCKTYSAGRWGAETQLTTGGMRKSYQNAFEDAHGNIWLFWSANRNIWCKTYSAGRWGAETQLTTGENKYYQNAFEDAHGNIWLFWFADNNIWCKTYSAGRWGAETQLTTGEHEYYRNAFEDAHGNIWLFWSANRNIWCKTYSAGRWGAETQLTTGDKYYRNAFEDAHGNIWLFWYADNNIWCKTYSAGRWGAETQLTPTGTHANYQNAFEDAHGNIWLFWSANRNIWCKTYRADLWKANTQLTTGAERYIKLFEDHEGSIWLLFYTPDYNNIWCKRYVDGDWLAEMRLCGGTTGKIYRSSFEDHEGNIWLFWEEWRQGEWRQGAISIWCKKCYASL